MKDFENNTKNKIMNNTVVKNLKGSIECKKVIKLSEFNCYLKIEKNGLSYNMKNFINSSLQKILIFEEESENKIFKRIIYINNSSNDNILKFETNKIIRIIDKFINQGKITIILEKDNLIIFISNSTKEILENFIKYIKPNINNFDNNKDSDFNDNTNNNLNSKLQKYISQDDSRFGKKRKFKDLHKNFDKIYFNNSNIEITKKNFEQNLLSIHKNKNINNYNDNLIKINKNKNYFNEIPQVFIIDIFKYLDKENSNNFSLANKFIKKIHDGFMENLELRSETPAIQIKNILQRYDNLICLKFGKGKKIKNEIFKNFCSNLKNLRKINLSYIDSLNEASILKIFSKTKIENLIEIKINFDLICLNNILNYINIFSKNIETFCFDSQKKEYYFSHENEINNNNILKNNFSKNFDNLLSTKKVSSLSYHSFIKCILMEKKNLKKINAFLLNFNILEKIDVEKMIKITDKNSKIINKNEFEFKIFSNLKIFKIEALVIKNIDDLLLLKNCINIEYLSIKNILLFKKSHDNNTKMRNNYKPNDCKSEIINNNNFPSNNILTKINFNNFKIDIEEIERELNANFEKINDNLTNIKINDKNEKINLNEILIKDFELQEDYIEIFVKIFSKIRKLKKIKLGDFVNCEILKIICTFSKEIEILKINSNEINDEDLILIMNKLIHLRELDLRGCSNIYGNSFIEIQKIPQNLKKIKLSIQSFNFYKVIDYLKSKNIEARNYI
jgi:hypothetical protein